jgi:hypothetical protein
MTKNKNPNIHHIHIKSDSGHELFIPVERRDGTVANMGSFAAEKALRIAAFERHNPYRQDRGSKGTDRSAEFRSEDAVARAAVRSRAQKTDLEQQADDFLAREGYKEDGSPMEELLLASNEDDKKLLQQYQLEQRLPYGMHIDDYDDDSHESMPGAPSGLVLSTDESAQEHEASRRKKAAKQKQRDGSRSDEAGESIDYRGDF